MSYSKYKSKKVKYNGIEFDSKKEQERYTELLLLKKANKIKDLILQPKYELQSNFKLNGKTYRAIHYIADFEYYDIDKNVKVVEDVKSRFTKKIDVYNLKKKLFLKKYGQQCQFIEIIR